MKKVIIFSLILCILLNTNIVHATINDIDNHWAYNQIVRGINNKWINGYEDNQFKPNNNIKRNEFIKILVSIIDDNIQINNRQWDKPYINYAYSINLIEDINTNFNIFITRDEVFKLIYNFINLKIEKKNVITKTENIIEFKDAIIDDYQILFLLNNNILSGYPDNTIRLTNYITRAEAICVINKAIDYINKYNYSYIYDKNIFNQENIVEYTNYYGDNKLFLNTYKINSDKVLFSDKGRISTYKNKYIEKYNEDIIKIILSLINKESYVLNTYNPYNKCVYIALGENKEYLNNGNSLFEVLLFEEKQKIKDFNYDVQINVYKLWKELNDINKNTKINEFYLQKFINLLQVFLSNEDLNNITYSIQNNMSNSPNQKYYLEKKGFNYVIYLNLFN